MIGMARDRPSPYGKTGRAGYRSAGACPPRSLPGETCPRPTVFDVVSAWRGTGPRPTGKRAVPATVARGPSDATRASERVSPAIVR